MKLSSDSFAHGAIIPSRYAFAKPHPKDHVEFAENRNPHLRWSDLPTPTLSLVLICHDTDCPTRPDNVNKDGLTVPSTLPRTDFFHWVLVDIAPDSKQIREGSFSDCVTPRGKPQSSPGLTRQGLNNYTDWFAGDAEMEGKYFGYDGPCPPWNDEIVHHYHFTLYALDVEQCPIKGDFRGPDVLQAIEGHILAQARLTGVYTLNPGILAQR